MDSGYYNQDLVGDQSPCDECGDKYRDCWCAYDREQLEKEQDDEDIL